MDKQYTRVSRFHLDRNPYRSTSDLIPKCRSQALRAKREAARSKINLIAKQLYELKYDHQWQQQQLKRLVNKGESIQEEVDRKLKKVQQEVSHFNETIEGLNIQRINCKDESAIVSQRSTQPEVENTSICQQKTSFMLYSHRLAASKIEVRNNSMMRSAIIPSSKLLHSAHSNKRVGARSKGGKQGSLKPTLTQIPISNIIIFVILSLVVLFLL